MALLLRRNKGIYLTSDEVDDNFVYLDDRITSLNVDGITKSNLMTQLLLVDYDNSGLNASSIQSLFPSAAADPTTIVSRDTNGDIVARNIHAEYIYGTVNQSTWAAGLSQTLPIIGGGTGNTVITQGVVQSDGSLLYATSTLSGTLISGSIPGNAQNVNGIVGINHGGTGASTVTDAQKFLQLIPGIHVQSFNNNLSLFGEYNGSGLLYKSGNIYSARSIQGNNGVVVTNGDGASGDPIIGLSIPLPLMYGGTGGVDSDTARASIRASKSFVLNIAPITNTIMLPWNIYAVNTGVSAINLYLPIPSNSTVGDVIRIIDIGRSFSTQYLTIYNNGSFIGGLNQVLICNVSGITFDLVYINSNIGWIVS